MQHFWLPTSPSLSISVPFKWKKKGSRFLLFLKQILIFSLKIKGSQLELRAVNTIQNKFKLTCMFVRVREALLFWKRKKPWEVKDLFELHTMSVLGTNLELFLLFLFQQPELHCLAC